MEEKIKFLADSFQTFTAGNKIWFLSLAALIFLVFRGSKRERQIFVWPVLTSLLVFNPLSASWLNSAFHLETRYLRLFWVLPFYEIVGYTAVIIMNRFFRRRAKAAAAIAVAAAIVLTGNPVFFGRDVPEYRLPQNGQYTEDSFLDLSILFHRDGIENPVVLYDGTPLLLFRTYDPSVVSVFSRRQYYNMTTMSEEEFNEENYRWRIKVLANLYFYHDFSVTPRKFRKAAEQCGLDYILTTVDSELNDYFEKMGLTRTGETYQYIVWRFSGT